MRGKNDIFGYLSFPQQILIMKKTSIFFASLFLIGLIVLVLRELRFLRALSERVIAPELKGGIAWLNTSKPIQLAELRGKVILLDFWTYCCINCMHVTPDLKRLEAEYPKELFVIGVHSAKFTNEKKTENIRQAILRYEIEHPVVNDGNHVIWRTYSVRAWPTLVLIDPEGYIISYFSGEGNYDMLDKAIEKTITTFRKRNLINENPIHFNLEKNKLGPSNLSFPGKILADESSGRLFIADSNHNRIVVTNLKGEVIDVAGNREIGKKDGTFAETSFNHPQGMAINDNILYVADTENHLIRELDLGVRTVKTIAGTGKQASFMATGGMGVHSPLNSPWDITFIDNKLYIAMAGAHQIWVMDLSTNLFQPYAGSGQEARIDGSLDSCALAQPSGITTDGIKLYFADSEVSSIRSADLDPNGEVNTIVGRDLFVFGDRDGKGNNVRLQHPLGILYRDGLLYVADTYNNKIKVINPMDKTSTTFLGTGKSGDKDGREAEFYEPGGLSFADGKFYIADTNNHAIRSVDAKTRIATTLKISGLKSPETRNKNSIQD